MFADRKQLPYRINCEGYFLYKGRYVVSTDSGKGYILFPGGGVDEGETPEAALLRESMEEAGVRIKNIRKEGMIHFDWGRNWASTPKQKKRYQKFRGEEMHFFTGEVEGFEEPKGDEADAWGSNKYSLITEAISIIEKNKPFSEDVKEYREMQLKYLNELLAKTT